MKAKQRRANVKNAMIGDDVGRKIDAVFVSIGHRPHEGVTITLRVWRDLGKEYDDIKLIRRVDMSDPTGHWERA